MKKIVIKKKPKVMNKTITKKTPKKKVKGFYRIDEFELNDGDIQVYRTNFSGKFWTMSCWISEEQRMFVKSLRTKDKDTASELAKKRYLEVQTLVISGQSVFDKSLGELCQMYLDDQKERIRIGHQEVGRGSTGITKGRWSAKQTQIKKHLLGFMDANTKLSTIKSEHFKRKYTQYRRKKNPDVEDITLINERTEINAVFKFALKKRLIQHHQLQWASVACALLLVVLYFGEPNKTQMGPGLEDIDLLASADVLELYEELEFYAWLAEENLDAG